jgi:hypothetical protein
MRWTAPRIATPIRALKPLRQSLAAHLFCLVFSSGPPSLA